MSEHDNNLLFVSDMLTKRGPDKLGVLAMYRDVCQSVNRFATKSFRQSRRI
jgi:hypothetical protein